MEACPYAVTDEIAHDTKAGRFNHSLNRRADISQMIARFRKLILAADPNLTEEWKWDTPVWSHKGNVVAAGVFKDHVKLNFFKGAALEDPNHLFNAGLDAKTSRGIDFYEGEEFDESALQDLVRTAAAYNASGSKKK